MSAALIAGQTPVAEALDSVEMANLLPSDGAAGTLSYNQLYQNIHQATGINIQAEPGNGLHAEYNRASAGIETPKMPEPQQDMDYTLQQQATMTMTNG